MIDFRIKSWFFDRPKVLAAVDAVTLEFLASAGALERMTAQRSMRYRSASFAQQHPSAPGTPPLAWTNHPWLRKHIYFAIEPQNKTVVIGPVRISLKQPYNVMEKEEFGGTVRRRNTRRRNRSIGRTGEIRLGGKPCASTKPAHFAGWHGKGGRKVMVTYVRIRSAEQAARANRLNEMLYGPIEYGATYKPRPYMGPALTETQGKLPELWQRSLAKASSWTPRHIITRGFD